MPTLPGKATIVSPTNSASDVSINVESVEWANGTPAADTYNVYFGTTSGNLTLLSSGVTDITFTVPSTPLNYITTYYWRIDTVNGVGTTTGDEWSFISIRFDPPTYVSHYVTTNTYWSPLVQADGTLGSGPPSGVENTDYVVVSNPNTIVTRKKLIACAGGALWIED